MKFQNSAPTPESDQNRRGHPPGSKNNSKMVILCLISRKYQRPMRAITVPFLNSEDSHLIKVTKKSQVIMYAVRLPTSTPNLKVSSSQHKIKSPELKSHNYNSAQITLNQMNSKSPKKVDKPTILQQENY